MFFFTGEYQLPLNSVDLAGPVEEWKDLAAVDDGSNQYLGDLCLSLRYVPSSGKLTGENIKNMAYMKDCLAILPYAIYFFITKSSILFQWPY